MPKDYEEKLKVAFIDDEKLVRQLLIRCVDWDELGYVVVGDSPGGQHALDMVRQERPDVVFVDICMPVIGGIEMSARIMEMLPDAHIIIVTGHQEFDYAREGIKVGVSDFLLKPINPREITAAALKVRDAILQERREREEVRTLKERMRNHYPHLKERALYELIHGAGGEPGQSLEYLDIRLQEPHYQVAIVSVDFRPRNIRRDPHKRTELTDRAKDAFGGVLERYDRVYYFSDPAGLVVLSNDSGADLYTILEEIKAGLSMLFPCVVSAGMSDVFTDISGIQDAYRQALEALEYKLVCGKGHIVRYAQINAEEREQPEDRGSDLLGFYLKSGLVQSAESAAYTALDALMGEGQPTQEQLHAAGAKVLSECLSALAESNIPAGEVFGYEGNPYEKIFAIDTLPQMRKYLRHCAGKVAGLVLASNQGKVRSIIQDVKKYIEENIADPELSLSGVANAFYINASYLSRMYKQETGRTFVDEVKRLRMEKLIKLLHETDMRVYQLCEQVGIEDPHYLSILFKKYTGMTISEYKQSLKNPGEKPMAVEEER